MKKVDALLKKANMFCKLATSNPADVITNHQVALQSEFNGGIRAINKLYSLNNPNYRETVDHDGLEALHNGFGKLNNLAVELGENKNSIDSAKSILKSMFDEIGQLSFFTSPGNAGAGYDPYLTAGGAVSPTAYLNRAKTHVTNLTNYLSNFSSNNATTKVTNIV